MFVLIGLTFKGNITVRLVPISILEITKKKLYHIPDKERNNQQLYLLFQMDTLVIYKQQIPLKLSSFNKNKRKNRDAAVPFRN